jgi:hypothetical protein
LQIWYNMLHDQGEQSTINEDLEEQLHHLFDSFSEEVTAQPILKPAIIPNASEILKVMMQLLSSANTAGPISTSFIQRQSKRQLSIPGGANSSFGKMLMRAISSKLKAIFCDFDSIVLPQNLLDYVKVKLSKLLKFRTIILCCPL